MKGHTIYKLTDVETRKSYIGSTAGKLSKRISVHRCLPKTRNYGKLCRHVREVLGTDYTTEEYDARFTIEGIDYTESKDPDKPGQLEMFYIAKFDTYRNGYNSTPTGSCGGAGQKGGQQHTMWRHDVKTEELVRMKESGMTYRAISDSVGMCPAGVLYRVRNYNKELREDLQ